MRTQYCRSVYFLLIAGAFVLASGSYSFAQNPTAAAGSLSVETDRGMLVATYTPVFSPPDLKPNEKLSVMWFLAQDPGHLLDQEIALWFDARLYNSPIHDTRRVVFLSSVLDKSKTGFLGFRFQEYDMDILPIAIKSGLPLKLALTGPADEPIKWSLLGSQPKLFAAIAVVNASANQSFLRFLSPISSVAVAPPSSPPGSSVQNPGSDMSVATFDFAELKFEIAKTEVVDLIRQDSDTLAPKDGQNLVIVTLRGSAPRAGRLMVTGFLAEYERATSQGLVPWADRSMAFTDKEGKWHIGANAAFNFPVGPGEVALKVAFTLPEGVSGFFVDYPARAQGKATLSNPAKR